MLLRSLKSDWIANFSILANLSTNWDTVEIFFLLLFYISRGDTWGCFFFLRRKQSRIISVSRINLHQCKFFYSVWLSFPSPFSHHFAQRSSWDIEELISDLKTALCRDLSSLLCTHVFVPLCTQWVFVFVSMLCVWSCGSSSVHDIAVIKEVNSSLCICVCVCVSESLKSFSGSQRAVGRLLNKPNVQHNSMNKTHWRHKRSRSACCSEDCDSNISLPAFCKRHCSNPTHHFTHPSVH